MINSNKSLSFNDKVALKSTDNSAKLFENLITLDELLELMKHQYSKHTVYRWVSRHGMPHKKIRKKLWFPKDQVVCWLERT